MARDLLLGESLRHWSRGIVGDEPFLWTPSAVRAELSRARNLLDLANREVGQAYGEKKLCDAEWASWSDTYRAGRKLTDGASSLWGSNVAPARQYATEAERWRALVRQRGGQAAAPEDAGRRAPPEDKKMSTMQVALLGVGGVIAAAMLMSAVKR
jgi:hypothetical protein